MLEIGSVRSKTLRRVTREEYGYTNKKRKLVVTLEATDLLTIREFKSRRPYPARLWDIYVWMVRCAADKALMEKSRLRKQRKAERLTRQRQASAERRFRQRLKSENTSMD